MLGMERVNPLLLKHEQGGGRSMPTYIALHNFTDEGIRTISQTIQRANGAADLAQQYGVSLQTYWTVGPYDVVYILEAPDDERANAFLLDVGSRGVVRTTTLRTYDREEMSGILERLGPAPGV
jgi:uncharacterized protein with GYD domain